MQGKSRRNATTGRLNKMPRRDFLRMSAAGVAGGVLAASPIGARRAKAATTIKVMVWGGAQRLQPRIDAFKRLYPEAAERIDIEVLSPGNHDAEVYQALRLGMVAGGRDMPDLVQLNYIGVPEFAETGTLRDISDLMAPYADDLTPGARALASYEGRQFLVPTQMKAKVWYYRKDLFEQAGIDIAQVKTFDDYMAAADRYRTAHPDSFIMNIGRNPIHYWYFMILSHWDDVRMADRDGNFLITDNPRFAEMMRWLKTWSESGAAFKTDDWSPDWQPAFADGVIGGSLISNWMNSFLPKFAPTQGGQWGLAPWPAFNRTGSEAGGGVLAIPAQAKNPEAAFEFASKMFLETDGAVDEWQRLGTPPSIRSGQEIVRSLARTMERPAGISDEDWATTPVNYFGRDFMDPIFAALDDLKVFPYDPSAQAELDILRRQTEAYIAGDRSLEQALAGAASDMRAQIGNPYAV